MGDFPGVRPLVNDQKSIQLPAVSGVRPFLPLLLVLFVGSGCSALIYEIVWFQLLQLVVGSSAISLGVLLGSFMGGMCLGSVILPRIISAGHHPLRVYALLELGIGIIGIALLIGMPVLEGLYTSHVGHGLRGILLRGAVCAVCLLPPTVLMGATLPAIARWTETTRQGVACLGFFYGANIFGAVFGCLLAGFYLLRMYDAATATYVAATINVVVALISLGISVHSPHRTIAHGRGLPGPQSAPVASAPSAYSWPSWTVYLAIAFSGMSALGAEVIWTRQLSLLLGASVYTFSIILAVFLMGLGLGSSVGAWWSRGDTEPRLKLGWCQLLLAAATTWTAFMLARSLPYWPIDATLPASPWVSFQLDLVRCLWAVLPAACLWGASFPLALAAVADRRQGDPGRVVGGLYAANTIGAIVGAIGFSTLVIPWLGTQNGQRLLVLLPALAAQMIFGPLVWQSWRNRRSASGHSYLASPGVGWRAAVSLVVLSGLVLLLVGIVPETPPGLIAYGRNLPTWTDPPAYRYVGEGMHASIAVSEFMDGTRNFHVSGKVVASSEPQDMRLQRMLGHVPALIHPHPKTVLVVGCGAGVTAGSFVLHPEIERIVICEIEPLIPPAAAKYFDVENDFVLDDPRVEVVNDDARHYILTTGEKFDIITSDPIHPWVKGAAALYSQEYFELCKQRLNPGGVVTQWVPLYETNLEAVKSEIATFFQVFADGTIWSNDAEGQGYDIVLFAHAEPRRIDADEIQQRLDRDDHHRVVESLAEVNLGSAVSLLTTYAGRAADLRSWLADAEVNRDGNLRLQYLAGMGLNSDQSRSIFDSLVVHRKYPENLFIAAGDRGRALKAALDRRSSRE